MNLESISFNYLVTNNVTTYQIALDNFLSAIPINSFIQFLENIKSSNYNVYQTLKNSVSPSLQVRLEEYYSLIDNLSISECKDVSHKASTASVKDLKDIDSVVNTILAVHTTTKLGQYAKIFHAFNVIGLINTISVEFIDKLANTADTIINYIINNNIELNKVKVFVNSHNSLKNNAGSYRTHAQEMAIRIREIAETTSIASVLSVLTQYTSGYLNQNSMNNGLLKTLALAGLNIAGIDKNAYVQQTMGHITGNNSFIPRQYAEYIFDIDNYTTRVKSIPDTYAKRFNNILIHVKDCAMLALLSSDTLDEAKAVVELHGKSKYKTTLSDAYYQNDLAMISVYNDSSKNKVLNSSIEDLAKVYPSRYFIQTMLLAKHFAGILKDDDIQWALTHQTNSNIQNGAMLFMETLCSQYASITVTVNKNARLLNVGFTKNSSLIKGQQQQIEKKYNLSYAMYGLYL